MKSLLGEGLEGFRERRSGRGWGRKISREQGSEEPGGRRIEDDAVPVPVACLFCLIPFSGLCHLTAQANHQVSTPSPAADRCRLVLVAIVGPKN